mgnify:CR=1 FL=1
MPSHSVRHLAGFTEQGDQAVEHAVVRVINGAENGADNDHGQDIRNVEDHAEEILPLDLFPREDRRKYQGERKCNDGDNDDQQDRILEGLVKFRVRKQLLEIVQADKFLVAEYPPHL